MVEPYSSSTPGRAWRGHYRILQITEMIEERVERATSLTYEIKVSSEFPIYNLTLRCISAKQTSNWGRGFGLWWNWNARLTLGEPCGAMSPWMTTFPGKTDDSILLGPPCWFPYLSGMRWKIDTNSLFLGHQLWVPGLARIEWKAGDDR